MQLAAIIDAFDEVSPIDTVRASGGAFRSPLWGRIVASVIDRPTTVIGESDGSSLGAAALGLLALGRAANLTDAVRALHPPASGPGAAVLTDPDEVALYRALRADVPNLLEEQLQLTAAFPAGDSHHQVGGPGHRSLNRVKSG